MPGAIPSLAAMLLLAAPEREYTGTAEIRGDETQTMTPVSGEVLPVPPPAVAPPPAPELAPVAPVPAPAPTPINSIPTSDGPKPKPTPKWWGPFPRPRITGFGGPVAHLTGLDGKFAMFVGLGGGVTLQRRVSIGGRILWLLNPSDAGTSTLGAKQRLNANYGGVSLDVVLVRKSRLDLSFAGLIGGGGACLQNPEKGNCYDRTSFFFGQPGLAAHIKLLPVVRLVLELGWRFVVAKQWTGPSNDRLGAPVGTVMIELGWF